jgi:alpha-glucosidase
VNETLASPAGNLQITISSPPRAGTPDSSQLQYSVQLNGKTVIEPSPLGLRLAGAGGNLTSGLRLRSTTTRNIDERYTMLAGKRHQQHNHAHEKTLTLENGQGQTLQVVFRAYNDGIAFRYALPGRDTVRVLREFSGFRIAAPALSWWHKYLNTYENYYEPYPLDSVRNAAIGFPALFETKARQYVLLTEAAVFGNFCASHLRGDSTGQLTQLEYPEAAVPGQRPWNLPWRVAIIGNDLGPIVESSLVEHLNPPTELKDVSWIKPGPSVFPWWSDHYANSSERTLRRFADGAAALGWGWLEFDVSLVGSPDHAISAWDTTAWIKGFVQYAADKKVAVYGWDEYKNLNTPQKRAYIFGRYQELGIRGIKIDFIDSDSLKAMRFRNDALRDASRYQLLVSFHGETLPRGQRRTYPHLMTQEAVKGAEYYTFTKERLPKYARHNSILPFTRNVVGPMDYTPVALTTPFRTTTYAHELAQAVLFESGWQVLCDKPEAYLASPARPLLQNLPAAWDDIHFIGGRPGEYACLARRKGADWYVAALNGSEAKTIQVPLDFISPQPHAIMLYEDGEDPNKLILRSETVTNRTVLTVKMAANGGFSTVIRSRREVSARKAPAPLGN